jgi:hypothetical protein
LRFDLSRQHGLYGGQSGEFAEVMEFIERGKLYGLGCGLVDMALLASALITPNARWLSISVWPVAWV